MTPYVVGTSAKRMEHTMGYDPVNFKRIQLDPNACHIRVSRDQKCNAVFELFCDNSVVMAFLFTNLRPWELNQKRDAFSRLFEAGKAPSGIVFYSVLPTQTVVNLPSYPMWSIHSPLGETGFWACDGLHLSVGSDGSKTAIISVTQETGVHLATFKITGQESDDEEVLDAAMTLRARLHMTHPIRIESVWEQEKLVWFHPGNHSSARLY